MSTVLTLLYTLTDARISGFFKKFFYSELPMSAFSELQCTNVKIRFCRSSHGPGVSHAV